MRMEVGFKYLLGKVGQSLDRKVGGYIGGRLDGGVGI